MSFEPEKTPLAPYTLPKAEMHVHISLALAEEIFLKRIKKKRTADIGPEFLVDRTHRYYESLTKFHAIYEKMRYLTHTQQELAQVTQMYLERIAREGAVYAEISNSFRNEAEFNAQSEAIEEGIRIARANTRIEARIVVTVLRTDGLKPDGRGPDHALAAARHLARYKTPSVTGFGLVGVENLDSLLDYEQAIDIAWHKAGLGLVPHVAEQYVRNAVDYVALIERLGLKVEDKDHRRLRTGHATLIHMSSQLMDAFARHGICIETCLSANKRINLPTDSAVKLGDEIGGYTLNNPLVRYFRDVTHHPLRSFIAAGIPVCLGSDNPLLMNTNIGKEYSLAVKAGLTRDQLVDRTSDAVRNANIDATTRASLLKKIDDYSNQIAQGITPRQTVLGYQHPYNQF